MLGIRNSASTLSRNSPKIHVLPVYDDSSLHQANSTPILATFPGKEEASRLDRDWLV